MSLGVSRVIRRSGRRRLRVCFFVPNRLNLGGSVISRSRFCCGSVRDRHACFDSGGRLPLIRSHLTRHNHLSARRCHLDLDLCTCRCTLTLRGTMRRLGSASHSSVARRRISSTVSLTVSVLEGLHHGIPCSSALGHCCTGVSGCLS